jgi:hypothetical protein
MGLALYPSTGASESNACDPGSIIQAFDSGSLSISYFLESHSPEGGSPLAASLNNIQTGLNRFPSTLDNPGAANALLLLVGDAPNCDPSLTASASNCSGDHCTAGACPASEFATAACACFDTSSGMGVGQTCLDSSASVQAVVRLAEMNIKVFVVGYGASVAGSDEVAMLSEMGVAGGTARADGGAFYQAADVPSLRGALDAILEQLASP